MYLNEKFYLNKEEPGKSCLLALRDLILKVDEKVSETIKYRMPCFLYGNTAFCYLWTDKKSGTPYILFVEGRYLDHPMLEQGTRKRMKIVRIDPQKDLPISTLNMLLNDSLDLYRNGIIKEK